MDSETWRPVRGFENYYEVSDLGRLRSLGRTQEIANRWGTNTVRVFDPKLLSPSRCSNGYLSFTLCGKRNRVRALVHRIVLSAFLPHENEEAMQVNHKNAVRDDNRLCNLEWVTCSANHKHAHGLPSRKRHVWEKKCRLVKEGVSTEFRSVNDAARYLGVNPASVSSAFHRGHKVCGFEVTT